jgi:hypothetical protein
MLLPEEPPTGAGVADPRRPRIRRYRLARFAAEGGPTAVRRPAGDFAHLRRSHD